MGDGDRLFKGKERQINGCPAPRHIGKATRPRFGGRTIIVIADALALSQSRLCMDLPVGHVRLQQTLYRVLSGSLLYRAALLFCRGVYVQCAYCL